MEGIFDKKIPLNNSDIHKIITLHKGFIFKNVFIQNWKLFEQQVRVEFRCKNHDEELSMISSHNSYIPYVSLTMLLFPKRETPAKILEIPGLGISLDAKDIIFYHPTRENIKIYILYIPIMQTEKYEEYSTEFLMIKNDVKTPNSHVLVLYDNFVENGETLSLDPSSSVNYVDKDGRDIIDRFISFRKKMYKILEATFDNLMAFSSLEGLRTVDENIPGNMIDLTGLSNVYSANPKYWEGV